MDELELREKFDLLVIRVLNLKKEVVYLENELKKIESEKKQLRTGERLTAVYNFGDQSINWKSDDLNQTYLKSKFGLI